MLVPFLFLQLASAAARVDPVYSSPALAEFIAAAAKDNRAPPPSLHGYASRVESELSLLVRDTLGRERVAQVEQIAMAARWERDGQYALHVIGYRSQTVGVPYSALSFARSWTTPYLYGDRLTLGVDVGQDRTVRSPRPGEHRDSVSRADSGRTASGVVRAVHPLASDRERFYRFSGGDTIAVLRVRDRRVPIVRVRVKAVFDSAARASRIAVFDGEIDFDEERHQIVRMRGQFVAMEGRRGRFSISRIPGAVGVAYIEFVNAEVNGEYWLPAYQRTEFQASFAPLGAQRSIFRLVSRFSDVSVSSAIDAVALASADSGADSSGMRLRSVYRRTLSYASSDSVSRFHQWRDPLGVATAAVHASDFDDLAPDVWRANGSPRFDIAPTKLEEVFRYNRVEGVYTGVAGDERFRSVAPGLTAHAYGGWAWSEETIRGGTALALRRGEWLTIARAERLLASTNDFTPPLENGGAGFGALFGGVDDQDYLDRRLAAIDLTRDFGGTNGALLTIEAGVGSDGPEASRIAESPLGIGRFRLNRASARGRYARGAATLELHPDVTGIFLQPGIGAILNYEIAGGGLAWQRAELTIAARQAVSDVVLALRVQSGVVAARTIPPQALFELGGENVLPGYQYKEFAGDHAVAAGVLAAYTFPLFHRPIRFVRSLVLPGLSPGLAFGIQGGWAEASTEATRLALHRLDPTVGADCEVLDSCPALLSLPTSGIRATVDARLTFFGGLVGVGVARPVDRSMRWRLALRFGQEY